MIFVYDSYGNKHMVGIEYIVHAYPARVMKYIEGKSVHTPDDKVDGCVIVLSNGTTVESITKPEIVFRCIENYINKDTVL